MQAAGTVVKRVVLTRLAAGDCGELLDRDYSGQLVLVGPGGQHAVPVRTGDSLALAKLSGAPVWVSRPLPRWGPCRQQDAGHSHSLFLAVVSCYRACLAQSWCWWGHGGSTLCLCAQAIAWPSPSLAAHLCGSRGPSPGELLRPAV